MRRSRFGLILAAWLLILIAMQPVTSKGQAQSPLPNLEVILLIDESGSMIATDPQDRRLDAVELFINTLGVDLSGADFRLALVAFNNDARLIGDGFVSLKSPGVREALLQRYRDERGFTAGQTDVLAGLQQARMVLNDHRPGYKPIVVVISDGRPETEEANANSPEALRVYNEELKQYAADAFDDISYEGQQCSSTVTGTPIYTIGIRSAELATEAEYPQELKDLWINLSSLSGGSYAEHLGGTTTQFQQNLQTIFTEFLRDWLCVQVDESTFEPLPISKSFSVNDSHAQLIFSIAKTDANVQVQIRNADGQEVMPIPGSVNRNLSGLSESWAILRPPDRQGWHGEWTINLTGPGEVSFIPIYITDLIRLNLISPAVGVLPLGGDLLIQAEILDNNGEPVSPDAILSREVTVIDPNNQPLPGSTPYVLQNGNILSVIPAPTQEGRYQINIRATILGTEGQEIPVEQSKFVELSRRLPWLNVTSPTIGSHYVPGSLRQIEAILMLHTQEFDGAVNQNQVRAKLYRIRNIKERIGEYELTLAPQRGGPGHYSTELPNNLPSGNYQLDVQLISQPLGGQKYEAPPVTIPFTIQSAATVTPLPQLVTPVAQPTATAIPATTPSEPLVLDIPPQLLIGGGGLMLLVVLGLILLLFVRSRPSLATIALEDISSYPNPANDMRFSSNDIRNYFARTRTIRDPDNNELAQLRFIPEQSGTTVELLRVRAGAQVQFQNTQYEEGDNFYPKNSDIIEINEPSNNVRLRFDSLEEDHNDYDYDQDDTSTL